jgi:tetratricopeptide (TPR) repeat protein
VPRIHPRKSAADRLRLLNSNRWHLFLAASIVAFSSGGLILPSQVQATSPVASSEHTKNTSASNKAATNATRPDAIRLKPPRCNERSADDDEDAKEYRLPVVINFRAQGGVSVRPEGSEDSGLREERLLVSINGQSMRGKSAAEITKLCIGNEGNRSVLGLLDNQGGYQTFTFKCKWLRKTQSYNPVREVRNMLYRFDCTNGPNWHAALSGNENSWDANNLDLFTAASSRDNLMLAKDDPVSSDALVDSVAVDHTGWLIAEGILDEARRSLTIVESTSVFDNDNPRQFDRNYGHLFTMLDLCGLNADGVKLGAAVFAADQSGKFFGTGDRRYEHVEYRVPAYEAYLQNLARTKGGDIVPVIEKLQGKTKEENFFGGEGQLWLGDFYEKIGQYEKAISCYETYLAQREHPGGRTYAKSESPDVMLSEARYHCFLLFRLAQFANKQTEWQRAVTYLQRAEDVYTSHFTEEQLTHIEGVPGFSPSPSAVDLALAGSWLKAGDSDSAVKYAKSAIERIQRAETADGKLAVSTLRAEDIIDGLKTGKWAVLVSSVGPRLRHDEPTNEDRTFMSTFVRADAAITRGDKISSRQLIDTLMCLYQKREVVSEYPRPCVNAYCCLLHLARRLSDRGRFDESDKLLNQLSVNGTPFDHTAVTRLFVDIEKALNADLSKRRQAALWHDVFDEWMSGYTDYQNLRALACLYLAAGEYDRAELMMDYSLKLCKNATKADASKAFNTALLCLDKAYLAGDRLQFNQIQKHVEMALSIVDSLPVSSASRDLDLFNRQFMCRAVQLAQLERLNNRSEEAEKILQDVLSRLDRKTCWLGVFEVSEHPLVDVSQAYLYGYYGRLLYDHNKLSKARTYLDMAIRACHNDVPNFLRTVRAECAAGQGDYSVAAQDLAALLQRDIFNNPVMSVQPKWKEIYSRMAIDYAVKAKGFDPEELSKLYKQLADLLDTESSKFEKLELLEKAYTLKPDTSRDKPQLAQEIANLTAIKRSVDRDQNSQDDHSLELKMQKSAAILAEKNNQGDAAQLWMNLAGSELQTKQCDQAIEHIERAIALQTKLEVSNLDYNSRLVFSDWPIRQLAEAGRPKDAEKLYQTLLGKTRDLYGPRSNRYSGVLVELCIFYAMQNNREQAIDYLDQLLALDPRKQELGKASSNARKMITDQCYGLLYKHGQNALASEILERLLDAQRKTYGSDDAHVAAVLTKIGIVETNNGFYEQAEKHLRDAIAIDALYGDEFFGGGSGAKSAIERLLELEHRAADRESLRATWKMDRIENEKHWSMAENANKERAQEFYDWCHKKEPYGSRCLSASIKLLEYAVKERNWDRVRELGPECIKILSHNSLVAQGGCEPSPQPATQKFYCFKSVIEACLESGHADEARKWLNRAISEESYEPMVEELIFLSEIENACGDKQAALSYCKRAEGLLPKTDGFNYWRWPVRALYQKLGSEDDFKRLDAEDEVYRLKRQKEDLRKFEAKRKLKLQQEAQLKQPPQVLLPASNNHPGAETEGSIEPKDSLMFPPVEEIKDKYLFNYAAYASRALWMNGGALVVKCPVRDPFSSYSIAGSHASMASSQPVHKAGDFIFMYDGPSGSLVPKFELSVMPREQGRNATYSHRFHLHKTFTAPPPVMAQPFKAAIEAPTTAIALKGANDRLILKTGDYTAENLSVNSIVLSPNGRVRIFLKDDEIHFRSRYIERPESFPEILNEDKSIKPVFEATTNSCINLVRTNEASTPRSNLELWYNGKGEIKLDANTHFAGIIYAPNATIRLGKKVEFWGAMVGKSIFVGEESKLMYQTGLERWSVK